MANLAASEYARERAYFIVWGRWVSRSNEISINRECGLTWAGSPPSLMPSAAELGEVVGLKQYIPNSLPKLENIGALVDIFATLLYEVDRETHAALACRHRRIVDGIHYEIYRESALARVMYGMADGPSQALLSRNCERGYRLFRAWFARQTAPLAEDQETAIVAPT